MHTAGNTLALAALVGWPLVAIYVFRITSSAQALLFTVVGGYLLLPGGAFIKISMIPAMDKYTVTAFGALVGCLAKTGRLPRLFHRLATCDILLACLLFGPILTGLLNADPIQVGPYTLPGAGLYDGVSAAVYQLLYFLPFVMAREFLRDPEDAKRILRALIAAGMLYSIPIIVELRMSPQLSQWIYGIQPFAFVNEARSGGFRPVVFLSNGLLLSLVVMQSLVAAVALWRVNEKSRLIPTQAAALLLAALLLMCRSLASLSYAVIAAPLARFTSPRTQLTASAAIALFALTYPALRIIDIVPTNGLVGIAEQVDRERAESLSFRFRNEDLLVRHADERFWFGWGRFGRNRVYDATGKDTSTTDGEWIIRLGTFGFVGFLAEFGLLGLGILRLRSQLIRLERSQALCWGALSLILAVNLLDSLPNASVVPLTWLMAGSIVGLTDGAKSRSSRLGLPTRPMERANV